MNSLRPPELLAKVKLRYEAEANPEYAEKQSWYMRNKFVFYGLKAPMWVPITKELFREHGLFHGEDLIEFFQLCFDEDQRELHYLGLQMIEKAIKKQEADFIQCLEAAIQQNSWWDSVDWIAKLVGIHFLRYPELIQSYSSKWIKADDFWLQRVAIIFQLRYKDKTDEALLYQNILMVADSQEFFLQKAAGWALRQYSRTNPDSVRHFIQNNQLAALTVREGARLMKKAGMW